MCRAVPLPRGFVPPCPSTKAPQPLSGDAWLHEIKHDGFRVTESVIKDLQAAASSKLQRAAELEPERARYAYVFAVALHSAGRGEEAMSALKEILVSHPDDRETLLTLISFSRDSGDFGTALEYAEQLARVAPGDASLVGLIENLRRQVKKPDAR
jgi:Flp pilus assembly protein TadD